MKTSAVFSVSFPAMMEMKLTQGDFKKTTINKAKGLFFLTLPQRDILRKVASSTCSLFVAKFRVQVFPEILTNKPRRKNARCGTSISFLHFIFQPPPAPANLGGGSHRELRKDFFAHASFLIFAKNKVWWFVVLDAVDLFVSFSHNLGLFEPFLV